MNGNCDITSDYLNQWIEKEWKLKLYRLVDYKHVTYIILDKPRVPNSRRTMYERRSEIAYNKVY